MRIACLQFAPQVGDVDNNLNRADAVLSKANQAELDDLDLLVLPELAFTGYNFQSLRDISPFLEPSGSGISSLWARTTALKYNCHVVLGYPEKVDVAPLWPSSPEYYNSTIIVNCDGETIGNYRKSFLYYVDEKWALEGNDGFYRSDLPGLGNIAMGICSDINPYKLEAPWMAFEFAFHVLQVAADVVILSMAWPTDEERRKYTRMPQEPDMDTITYWVQRLEPLIRAEQQEEIIVVFCNRSGTEGDLTYAGTSAVIGIKGGEVSVYGLLGRGVKELLVVDTDLPAFAKLVQRSEPGQRSEVGEFSQPLLLPNRTSAPPPPEHADDLPAKAPSPASEQLQKNRKPPTPPESIRGLRESPASSPSTRSPRQVEKPRQATGEKRSQPAQASPLDTSSLPRLQSPTISSPRKERPISPRIEIPSSAFRSAPSGPKSSKDESPLIATPTAPSPTPFHLRPMVHPPVVEKATKQALTPYPGMGPDPMDPAAQSEPFIYDGCVTVTTELTTPSAPYLEFFRASSPHDSKYYWQPWLHSMHPPSDVRTQKLESLTPRAALGNLADSTPTNGHMPRRPFRSPSGNQQPSVDAATVATAEKPQKVRVPTPRETQPPLTVLSSPSSSSQRPSRGRGPPMPPPGSEREDPNPASLSNHAERTDQFPISPVMERGARPFDFFPDPMFTHRPRGRDTKPREASSGVRPQSTSRASIPIAASPSIFDLSARSVKQGAKQLKAEAQTQQEDTNSQPRRRRQQQKHPAEGDSIPSRPTSRRSRAGEAAAERKISRPTSRRSHHDPADERAFAQKMRSKSLGGEHEPQFRRVRATDIAAKNLAGISGGNLIARPQTSIGLRRNETPPKLSPTYFPQFSPTVFSRFSPTALSVKSDPSNNSSTPQKAPVRRISAHGQGGAERRNAAAQLSSPNPPPPYTGTREDEIIVTISRIKDDCPFHANPDGSSNSAVVKSKEGILYAVDFLESIEAPLTKRLASEIAATPDSSVVRPGGVVRRQSAVW